MGWPWASRDCGDILIRSKLKTQKKTKKPIIHNSTIWRRLIHLKFVVEKLRATKFSKNQFKIGVIRFYITDRGTAAVAPWVQRGFNVGSTWADCPHDTASFLGFKWTWFANFERKTPQKLRIFVFMHFNKFRTLFYGLVNFGEKLWVGHSPRWMEGFQSGRLD